MPNDPLNNSPKERLAILVSKNINPQKINVENISPGRATKVDFQVNKQNFSAFCIYAPSQGDSVSEKFYTDLLEIAERTDNSIIIGDFNVVLDPKMDRKDPSRSYHKPNTLKLLTTYMLEHAMVNPWRATYPQKVEFSWENTRSAASRIDYSLIPAHLYHQVAKTEYTTAPIKTDHKIFEIQINLDKFKTGRGYPKVKNSLYSDPTLCSKYQTW